MFDEKDLIFMKEALVEAELAFKEEEVPVGAVIVSPEGKIIGKGRNQIIKLNDPTAHAEILAIREACKNLGNFRLLGCKIYVTLEPCPMCAYALVLARIEELIFATRDEKTGACGSIYNLVQDLRFNHRIKIREGLLKEEAQNLLKEFFKLRR
ncbi:CMP/dCMP deaminase zinc-binding protein [Thermodesulfobacterium geofontis OPF15]|jgi:tRNA(adenine34) deaminase|uniref:tRNA-specific adenosine deaminase n=1 Tax=Thermodesulfobacterium geofontis (strain OPF15) TaxID=795359 RepID=F8C479_THEGP|nr:tRNA adenosine(34) deaminase TadA [Thermodesulfobacterium geofontis]AEH22575.1 CMP/dCMP deaminase zinc-binding protein [Thermodesulfobacterium geofontis OPF15]